MQSLIILSIISVVLNYFMGWYLIQASAHMRGYQSDTLSTYIDSLYKPYRRLYHFWYQKLDVVQPPRLWLNLIFYLGASVLIIGIDIRDVASMFAENNIKPHLVVGLVVRAACLMFFLCSPLLARPIGRAT